jgi:hypothetical protein
VSEDPGRQPRWKPLLKLENSAKNHLNIIFSETAGPIGPKLWWNGLQMVLFVFDDPGRKPRWLPLLKIENLAKNHLKNISSETTVPIWPKLWWNGLSVVIFQNCVRRPGRQPRWPPLLKLENSAENHLNIISSETAGPIGPKLWWNGLQMVLFVFDDPDRKPR